MNRLTAMLALVGLLVFQACSGPEGPRGPEGPQGEPGINILGSTYEVEVDFTSANGYSGLFTLPTRAEQSDVALVYLLWEVDNQNPVWRARPQTVYFEEGILVYNFDFTRINVRMFLDGPITYSILGPEWTQDQLFRIVIVPSDFASNRIDWTDYDAVTNMLGIKDSDFQKIKLN